jgi:hypothetical protein
MLLLSVLTMAAIMAVNITDIVFIARDAAAAAAAGGDDPDAGGGYERYSWAACGHQRAWG